MSQSLTTDIQHEKRITVLRTQLARVSSAGTIAGIVSILAALIIGQFAPHLGAGFGATGVLMAGSLTSAVSLQRRFSLKTKLERELQETDSTAEPGQPASQI